MQRELAFQSVSIMQNNFANQWGSVPIWYLRNSGEFFSKAIVQAIALQTINKGIEQKRFGIYLPVFIFKGFGILR